MLDAYGVQAEATRAGAHLGCHRAHLRSGGEAHAVLAHGGMVLRRDDRAQPALRVDILALVGPADDGMGRVMGRIRLVFRDRTSPGAFRVRRRVAACARGRRAGRDHRCRSVDVDAAAVRVDHPMVRRGNGRLGRNRGASTKPRPRSTRSRNDCNRRWMRLRRSVQATSISTPWPSAATPAKTCSATKSTTCSTCSKRAFDASGRVLALLNHPQSAARRPLATATNLERGLRGLAQRMDVEEDVLFLYLTSHGSPEHELYVNQPPLPLDQVSPPAPARSARRRRHPLARAGGLGLLFRRLDRRVARSAHAGADRRARRPPVLRLRRGQRHHLVRQRLARARAQRNRGFHRRLRPAPRSSSPSGNARTTTSRLSRRSTKASGSARNCRNGAKVSRRARASSSCRRRIDPSCVPAHACTRSAHAARAARPLAGKSQKTASTPSAKARSSSSCTRSTPAGSTSSR